jgi:hypothetical protein
MNFCACTEAFGDGSQQVKLPSGLITFRVDGQLPGLSKADFEAACMEAWRRWERVIGIKVDKHANPKTDPTQYVLTAQMDGGSGVLADQELPYGRGTNLRMRVDHSERWTVNDAPGQGLINLIAVLAHEDGHCLGMQHISPEGDADLMNPTYSPKIYLPQEDDISYGRKLYGPPVVVSPPANPTNAPSTCAVRIEFDAHGGTYRATGTAKRVA